MSTADDHPQPLDDLGIPERHEASDGTVFWGDIPVERFEKAADTFPVLKFVLESYFQSPERPARDQQFVDEYMALGEDGTQFEGLTDDLGGAIRQYALAASLVNGLIGADLPPAEVRARLSDLRDQLHQRGAYAPVTEPEGPKAFRSINTAPQRVQATWMHRWAVPVGSLQDRPLPLVAYLGIGVGLVILGILVTFIPVVGKFGVLFVLPGGIIAFVAAVVILQLAKDFDHPEDEDDDEDDDSEGGFLSRLNPFSRS